VVALHNFFPSRGIARDAATDEQSDNLGFFQTRLPRLLDSLEDGRFCPSQLDRDDSTCTIWGARRWRLP
jgi:hypothetical protein